MRIRLDIGYDGSHFRGWARQPGLRTVQGVLEAAIERVLGAPLRLTVAGRTDSGVHAVGQVAHLDVPDEVLARAARRGRDEDAAAALAGRIRGVLGAYPDVTVRRTWRAPDGFDARFSAVWRRYEYRIADDATGYEPLERHRTTTVRGLLDVAAMDAAAGSLLGLHDFAAYCRPREGATTVRTLLDFGWRRDENGVVVGAVRADAFCHSMVRSLAGACVAVGSGRLAGDEIVAVRDAAAREGGPRGGGFAVLPARGLTLMEVGYPEDALLAARAEQTRARRDRDD